MGAGTVAAVVARPRGVEVATRAARTARGAYRWPHLRSFAMPPSPTACPMPGSAGSQSCRTSCGFACM